MMATRPRRQTVREQCGWVALIAVAMGVARMPDVWECLDARIYGHPTVIGLYVWFWVGMVLAACLGRTVAQRMFGFAGVFFSILALMAVLPRIDLAILNGYHAYFPVFLILGSGAFAVAGLLAWIVEAWARWRVNAAKKVEI